MAEVPILSSRLRLFAAKLKQRRDDPAYNLLLVCKPESDAIMADMESVKYIYWQDQGQWLGYLQDYADYWTQDESLEDPEAHLHDLHNDLTSLSP